MPNNTTSLRRNSYLLYWILCTWLPPLLGVLVICGESTEVMGAAHTSHFLRPIFERIFGHISDPAWELLHHIIRKTGHFTYYGSLSLLFVRAWYRTYLLNPNAVYSKLSQARLQVRAGVFAIFCTFLVASADELHQLYVPGRQGLFTDILLDTSGAITFHCLLWLYLKFRSKQTAKT